MHFLVISLLTPYFETYDNMLMVRMNSGVPLHDNASSFSFSFFLMTISPAPVPFYKRSLNHCNSITVSARDKIQMVSQRREDQL